MGFKVWEYHLSTNAVRRQYYPVWKVKIYSGTDNFQSTLRQIELHIIYNEFRHTKGPGDTKAAVQSKSDDSDDFDDTPSHLNDHQKKKKRTTTTTR